jgi:hypothetical protein
MKNKLLYTHSLVTNKTELAFCRNPEVKSLGGVLWLAAAKNSPRGSASFSISGPIRLDTVRWTISTDAVSTIRLHTLPNTTLLSLSCKKK